MPSALFHRPVRRFVARFLLAAAAVVGPVSAGAQPVPFQAGSPALAEVLVRALDDPRAALEHGRHRLASAAPAERFWWHLALVDVLVQSDQEALASAELAAAGRLVDQGPDAARRRLWLGVYTRMAELQPHVAGPAAFHREQAAVRAAAVSTGDKPLLCTARMVDAIVQVELGVSDEAWAALEAAERCGGLLGDVGIQTYALGAMGLLASRVSGQLRAEVYFERAIAALGSQPARYKRAWLLDDLGWALLERGQFGDAQRRFEESLALALAIGDVSTTMRGHEGVAEARLRQLDAVGALRHARASLQLGGNEGLLYRPVTAQTQVVEALALEKHPDLAREIERLRAIADRDRSAHTGVLIARSASRGYLALGRHEEAYRELERYLELTEVHEKARRASEAQHLQTRYEAARRDAENSELRRVADAARLELEVRTERQRAMLAALAALSLVLAGGCWWLMRALRRRRRLADLALRDELTGLPNRRAVLAFAREQFQLAQRLNLPLSLALIDLDRFKQVNDTHGHAAGDHALQAFGVAAQRILRGQDRIGRWGGEEWLLVMPGTRADELALVFDRLRASLAAQPIPGLPLPHRLTFSMGVAERRAEVDGLEAMIAEADRQLYRAKAQGRDALCGHSPVSAVSKPPAPLGRAA
jgi:diguanylate cyclase (GGDEF)-like protein